MPTIQNELAAALSTVCVPGDFHAAGTIELPLPRLEVQGVGAIALPLLPAQAAQIIAVAERAPFGRGADTIVDTDVRRTWQIGADRIRIEGRRWAQTLEAIVGRVAAGLGVTATVVPELYKLLVYDQGSFFVGHRDTEKAPGMFATLVVVLPSVHTGGELVVRHKGREVRLDLSGTDLSEAAFAAFYADCVHEVLPITSGCRLALVYNLLRRGRGRLPTPPSYETETAQITTLLARWSAGKGLPEDQTPEKLVYPLEHAYTPAELSFHALKGADAAAATVLDAAGEAAGCELHLALLTIEEDGFAEYIGYGQGYDDDEFEAGDVCDRSATLSDWQRVDGSAAALGVLPFLNDELCPGDAFEDMEPDEQHFQEATGNEGASFERSYRRAALVLWPQHRRLAVLNQAGLSVTLPYLVELTARWARSGKKEGSKSPLWCEAHELCAHMLRTWPRPLHQLVSNKPSDVATLLGLLTRLNDTAHIEACLADICASGNCCTADNEAVLRAAGLLTPHRAGELIARMVAANASSNFGACADLLARAAGATHTAKLAYDLAPAAKALAQALPGNPAHAPAPMWKKPAIDSGVVVGTITALEAIDPALAEQATVQMLSWRKAYGLDAVVLPAIRLLARQSAVSDSAAMRRLRTACLVHLRARIAEPLEAPRDWCRIAKLNCACRRCNELGRFLASADQRTWVFKAAEVDRSHVEESIKRNACDVDCETSRHGRPYSLVCTKNQASYDRRAKQHKLDLDDLALLAP